METRSNREALKSAEPDGDAEVGIDPFELPPW